MLKKDYETMEYGDYVRPNGGPLMGLILQVVNAEGDDIYTQQENNPAFIYIRNYRAFDIVHHFTDLERLIQHLHDTVWDRNPMPDRGRYPEVEGAVSKDYWMKKADTQFRNRNEEKITQGLYLALEENGIRTIDDLINASTSDIAQMANLDSVSVVYTCMIRENEMRKREGGLKA